MYVKKRNILEYIQVFSAGNITGIFGDKCYWYFRRYLLLVFSAEVLLVFSAGKITGFSGGNYYL